MNPVFHLWIIPRLPLWISTRFPQGVTTRFPNELATRYFQWSQYSPRTVCGVIHPQYHWLCQQSFLRSVTPIFFNRSGFISSTKNRTRRTWRGTTVTRITGKRLRRIGQLPYPGCSATSSSSLATYLQISYTCIPATTPIWHMVISSRSLIWTSPQGTATNSGMPLSASAKGS